MGLGDIVSLAKPWKKLNAEDLLEGDQAALSSAVKVRTPLSCNKNHGGRTAAASNLAARALLAFPRSLRAWFVLHDPRFGGKLVDENVGEKSLSLSLSLSFSPCYPEELS